jgi:hypothetical protein
MDIENAFIFRFADRVRPAFDRPDPLWRTSLKLDVNGQRAVGITLAGGNIGDLLMTESQWIRKTAKGKTVFAHRPPLHIVELKAMVDSYRIKIPSSS